MRWTSTQEQLPPQGAVVETKIDDSAGERKIQKLRRRGRLWYFADDSMYVYYTPTHWRQTEPAPPIEPTPAVMDAKRAVDEYGKEER
jgi:hypothetical protein